MSYAVVVLFSTRDNAEKLTHAMASAGIISIIEERDTK